MSVTLSADLTPISACDALTDWSSSLNLDQDTDYKREGAASVGMVKASQAIVWAKYDYYTANGNSYLDILDDTHFYFWVCAAIAIGNQESGGIAFYLEDSTGKWAKWYVGGSNNYYGGFQSYVCYTGLTPDSSSEVPSTLNKQEIRYIGAYINVTGKSVVNANNVWLDIFRYGTGLVVKGGTSESKGTFDEIIAADVAPAYGVMAKRYGAYILQGPIVFGDAAGAADSYFKDTGQLLLFADAMVSPTHYNINIVGNAGKINSFELGTKTTAGQGISGCFIKSVGANKYNFTATDTNVGVMGLYGCTFYDAGTIQLRANAANVEFLSCSFEACAEVLPVTTTIKYCTFVAADSIALRFADVTCGTYIVDNNFVDCPYGVECTVEGTFTFDALKFSPATGVYHVHNTSGLGVTVEKQNLSNASTFTGSTTLKNMVDMNIHCQDSGGNDVVGASCYIEESSNPGVGLMNEVTDEYGDATEKFNYQEVPVPIALRIRKSTLPDTRYYPVDGVGTITAEGFSFIAVLQEDLVTT